MNDQNPENMVTPYSYVEQLHEKMLAHTSLKTAFDLWNARKDARKELTTKLSSDIYMWTVVHVLTHTNDKWGL